MSLQPGKIASHSRGSIIALRMQAVYFQLVFSENSTKRLYSVRPFVSGVTWKYIKNLLTLKFSTDRIQIGKITCVSHYSRDYRISLEHFLLSYSFSQRKFFNMLKHDYFLRPEVFWSLLQNMQNKKWHFFDNYKSTRYILFSTRKISLLWLRKKKKKREFMVSSKIVSFNKLVRVFRFLIKECMHVVIQKFTRFIRAYIYL